MNVLVTGATGFLGSYLCRRLVQNGETVWAQGRNLHKGIELETAGCRFLAGDLTDKKFVQTLPKNLDAVVHCAALSSPWGRYGDFYAANVVATENLIAADFGQNLSRFVYISSPSIYVSTEDRFDIRESDALPNVEMNHYIRTKRLAEASIERACAHGFPAVVLRPQGIVGAGDPSIFPRILKAARRGRIPRIGRGRTQMDLTYVENVVDAVIAALNANPTVIGRKYNITNGEPVEIYEVIDKLMTDLEISYRWKDLSFKKAFAIAGAMEWGCRYLLRGREPLLTRYSVCVLGVSRTLNIEAARTDLGYQPQVSMAEAMKRVAEAMK